MVNNSHGDRQESPTSHEKQKHIMSTPNASSMLAVGTVLNGKYRIERHLSSGGFGNTYVAINLTLGDKVAVKEFFMRGVTQRDGDSTISVSNPDNRALFIEQLEKFKKEAQRIRRLQSPNIIRVHDMFDANGTAYYVMDYIDGESLSDRLKRTGKPLSEGEVRHYLAQVLDALEVIHSAGLYHMDLKPDNIMVDGNDRAVLIDFGASKRVSGSQMTMTATGVSYTNGYAPPEQMEQDTDHFGPWTDIYALGATLYRLLTNRKPPMPSAIYSDPTPDKHEVLPFPEGVSTNMRRVIVQMLAVRWNVRPQSIAALRNMLAQGDADFADDDESTEMMGTAAATDEVTRMKGMAYTGVDTAEDTNEYVYDGNSSSRKKLYAAIGVWGGIIIAVLFFLLRGGSDPKADLGNIEVTTVNGGTDSKVAPGNTDTNKEVFNVNGVSFNMIKVSGGTFQMGATFEQGSDAYDDERPVHSVTLSDYYIGETEVTQELWTAVMGNNPSEFSGTSRPVGNVSWDDCQTFITKLNQLTGYTFRLPTEAEWEFAARGGNKSKPYKYSGSNDIGSVAWYDWNSVEGDKPHPVAQKQPNELGIYDMSGNVWEWCNDWYGKYTSSAQTNPHDAASSSDRVLRGGCWFDIARYCRVSYRINNYPGNRNDYLGLRLAL